MSQLSRCARHLSALSRSTRPLSVSRCLSSSAALLQQPTDPIQKLFVDKLREYGQKSKSTKDGLVDPSENLKKEMQAEMERITRSHGFQPGEDTTKFPEFTFTDPPLDPIEAKQQQ